MTKLPRFAAVLILTLSGIAQETPATTIAPRQVDDVVNHLEDNLKAYVFPRVSEELRKQISAIAPTIVQSVIQMPSPRG